MRKRQFKWNRFRTTLIKLFTATMSRQFGLVLMALLPLMQPGFEKWLVTLHSRNLAKKPLSYFRLNVAVLLRQRSQESFCAWRTAKHDFRRRETAPDSPQEEMATGCCSLCSPPGGRLRATIITEPCVVPTSRQGPGWPSFFRGKLSQK